MSSSSESVNFSPASSEGGDHDMLKMDTDLPAVCPAFNSGNVVFRSSDDVIFRVHDYHLKAARWVEASLCMGHDSTDSFPFYSGFFRDMLDDSISSFSNDNPLPMYENSVDLEIVLTTITGRAQHILHQIKTWSQAKTLHDIADKYQLDAHRPWFSQICRRNAVQEPWEAIFLATNQSPMDTDLIHTALADGF
jgi:hypothetical protein